MNRSTPLGNKFNGWFNNRKDNRLDFYVNGVLVMSGNAQKQVGLNGVNYLFPATAGSNGQQLTTNGSGTLSWAAAS